RTNLSHLPAPVPQRPRHASCTAKPALLARAFHMATTTLSPRISLISIAFGAGLPLLLLHPAEAARGYKSRACGLDMNRNGIVGECANHAGGFATCPDCSVCNGQGGVTSPRDVDG